MSYPKKSQHNYPYRDVATAGRLEGTLIPSAKNWWASKFAISGQGLSTYSGVDMDAPIGQENQSDGSNEPASATSTGPGAAAGPV